MTLIEINSVKISFPSSWAELTPVDFHRVGAALALPWSAALQYTLIRLLTPQVHPQTWTQLADWQIAELLPITDFMKNPVSVKPMPLFRLGWRRHFLPDVNSILTADYAFSEPLLQNYVHTNDEQWLNQLVVTICRPRKWWIIFFPFFRWVNLKWNGDMREPIHSAIMEKRAKRIARLPLHTRLVVVWWVVQLRWEVQRNNKELFTPSGNGSSKGGDWIDATFSIGEQGLFGDHNQVMLTNFQTILRYLNHKKNQQEK